MLTLLGIVTTYVVDAILAKAEESGRLVRKHEMLVKVLPDWPQFLSRGTSLGELLYLEKYLVGGAVVLREIPG
jgi:hypothetical protein